MVFDGLELDRCLSCHLKECVGLTSFCPTLSLVYAVSCEFAHSLFSVLRREERKTINLLTSDQTRLPAEFKHINKRRKRN